MTDLQILFIVLAALYGWECACWAHRGSVACRAWLGPRFKLAHPSRLLGNQRGGFVFAHPLPPLGTLFLTTQFPVSISPEAVLAFVSPSLNPGSRPPQGGRLYPFDEILTIKAEAKRILINGDMFVRAASSNLASNIANELQQLKAIPASKRAKAIELMLHQTFDLQAIEQRRAEFQNRTRSLRVTTNGLFWYMFIAVPAVIWKLGLVPFWPVLLAVLLAGTTAIAVCFRRLHEHFFAALDDERFTYSLIILLSPATAIRAIDLLSRPLLEAYHPLAVAKILCPEPGFRALASHYLREIRYPALPICPRPESAAIEKEMRALLQREVEGLLAKAGLDPEELIRPPMPAESGCLSYCPRCLAQFTISAGACEDCGGIPLVPFAAKPASLKS